MKGMPKKIQSSAPRGRRQQHRGRAGSAIELVRLEFDIARLERQLAQLDQQRASARRELDAASQQVKFVLRRLSRSGSVGS